MKKVSYDKFDEYASTFEPGYNLLEEKLRRSHLMALKLADLLNEKIDECESLKKDVKWYVERVMELEKQLYLSGIEARAAAFAAAGNHDEEA